MLEKKVFQGYFFAPENPNKKISGILYYFPNDKIRLELIGGCLSGTVKRIFCQCEKLNAIFGVIKTENGTSNVTLLDCYGSGEKSSNSVQNCEICMSNYSCSYLLIGRHLENKENAVFNKIRVSFPCFNDWYKDNTIQFDCENDYTAIFKVTNDSKNTKRFEIDKKTNMNLIGFSTFYDIKPHEKCLYENSYIELESIEKSNFFDLLVQIGWFKDFYSFAAMTAMPFSEISFYNNNNDDDDDSQDGMPFFYIAEEKFEKNDKLPFYHFLFDFENIKDDFETTIKNWYEKKNKSEPIIQQLISSVTLHRFIKSSDFLTIIQSIDGYYSRFIKDNCKVNEILTDLCGKYKDIQLISEIVVEIDKVKDSRNYYSHLSPESTKPNLCKSWELYELAEKLKPLLICCILSLIGFDNIKINTLLSNYNQFKH